VTLAIEILFVLLVAADYVLTYKIVRSGKGVEVGKFARHYIQAWTGVPFLTILMVVVLIGWLRVTGLWFFLIPADLYMGRLVYRNWRVLNG
jgi:hypothetical protein